MNISICGLTKKTIRNWEKQCFFCAHCKLVMLRDHHHHGEIIEYGSIYLFNCPHIGRRFVKVGKNSKKDTPQLDTRLVMISGLIPYFSRATMGVLNWQELIPPQPEAEKTFIAEIPRQVLQEWGIIIPLRKKPCLECTKRFLNI